MDLELKPKEGAIDVSARLRDLGPPDAVEVRERNMGQFYSLRVSGTF